MKKYTPPISICRWQLERCRSQYDHSAALPRVARPAYLGMNTPREDLLRASSVPRISSAYFVDPNDDVSIALKGSSDESCGERTSMSISEYIKWCP